MSEEKLPVKKNPVAVMMEKNWPTIKNVVPKHLTPERLARIAYTAIVRNPKLAACQPMSLANAVIEASMLGLEIGGPLGMAHLVPFKDQVVFIPGYKGLMDLAYRSGKVSHFSAHPVYENDHFVYQYGISPKLEHRPSESERGPLKYAYAICKFNDGGFDFEVVNRADIAATKKKSSGAQWGGKDCPWNNEDEWTMWVKTAIRRLAKRIPQSPDMQRAVAADELAEAGKDQGLAHIIDIEAPAVTTAEDINEQLQKQEETKQIPKTTKRSRPTTKEMIQRRNEAKEAIVKAGLDLDPKWETWNTAQCERAMKLAAKAQDEIDAIPENVVPDTDVVTGTEGEDGLPGQDETETGDHFTDEDSSPLATIREIKEMYPDIYARIATEMGIVDREPKDAETKYMLSRLNYAIDEMNREKE